MLKGKFLEVLWEVLPRVLWEIGVLRGVLRRVLRGIRGAPGSAPESAQCGASTGRALSGALPGAPRIPLSTLRSTPRSTPISQSTLGSTSQSTSRNFPFSTPVTGRHHCKGRGRRGGPRKKVAKVGKCFSKGGQASSTAIWQLPFLASGTKKHPKEEGLGSFAWIVSGQTFGHWEEPSMDQYQCRGKLLKNFQDHWSIRISPGKCMDQ